MNKIIQGFCHAKKTKFEGDTIWYAASVLTVSQTSFIPMPKWEYFESFIFDLNRCG